MGQYKSECLKQISTEISPILTSIINKSFDTGCFPDCLKIGIIKPLYKSGDKQMVSNYRPISLLSIFSKVMEQLIKKRMVTFLTKFKILSDLQFGFREGRSTQDAIQFLTSHISDALDNSEACSCLFVDLSKAFDTVCHDTLLKKLKNCGLRGKMFDLMNSYLTNRKQRVNIDGTLSDERYIKFGVPQGTVLGPLLFTIYINDMLGLKLKGTLISFADDTVLFCKAKSWQLLKVQIEDDFVELKNWYQYNKLTLNVQKTKYMPFSTYKNFLPKLGNIKIANYEIPETTSFKYLGIKMDNSLRWDLHINELVQKIRGLLSRFSYLRDFLSTEQMRILYMSLVQSHLTYGILGWGGVSEVHLRKLNTIQKWFIKIIFGKDRTYPTNDLFSESKTLDLRQLYCLEILKNIKKEKITFNIGQNASTRRHALAYPTISHKTHGQRSLKYYSPRLYNMLPNDIKLIESCKSFKVKAKNWIFLKGRQAFNNLIDLKYIR